MRRDSLVLDQRWPREFLQIWHGNQLHVVAIDMTREEAQARLDALIDEMSRMLDEYCSSVAGDCIELKDQFCKLYIS